ncbi:putative inactive receptor kinase, partial [Trifolium medium]|nr:putative inactive receptor kinase [Trifolium medium]
ENDGCITDVGLTPLMNTSSTMSRSNGYRAPEASESRNITTQKSDIYNFGVLLLEMLAGKTPLGYSGYMIMTWMIFQGGLGGS